jgi:hypothetical protein
MDNVDRLFIRIKKERDDYKQQLEQVSKLPEIWKDRRMCEISATGFDYNELLDCANELKAILDKS